MRVLIVEDEAKMAGLLRRGLEREGFAVDAIANGEEAVRKAEAVGYDAILLDLCCRGSTGSRSVAACGRRASGHRS
jgi:DNA-binding response OmpR family regulator